MKLLITGSMGWLGRRLTELLINGFQDWPDMAVPAFDQIRCLALPAEDTHWLKNLSQRIEVMSGDIRNPEDCQKFFEGAAGGILIHAAGIIHPARVKDFYDVNLRGTQNLVDAAIRQKLKRVVIVSSNSPIGCNPAPDHVFDENAPYNPYMNYGKSKMMMEKSVMASCSSSGLEYVIVRPPWFYGPHQPPRQTLFFRMIRDGKMPIVGDGSNRRSMGYVDNLSHGLILAATKEKARNQIYWIADEQPYSMNHIIDTVKKLLETEFQIKCSPKKMKLPFWAGQVAQMMDSALQGVGIYQQKIHVLSEMNKTIACTVQKAKSEIGYQPKISLEEGMRRSMKWVRSVNPEAF